MNIYDPEKHHRRSIRLKGYDYSQSGLYFITICTQNYLHLFGGIENGKLELNDAGRMVEKWYYELENKYFDIKCHEKIVMPNHFHCIIEIRPKNVGADLRVCPKNVGVDLRVCPKNVGADLRVCPKNVGADLRVCPNGQGEHTGSPLHCVVQWFKTMVTNEYIRGVKKYKWRAFNKKLWQRNYWEHIIRNKNEFSNISQYIKNNPMNWQTDKLNDVNGNRINEPHSAYGDEIWMV